MSNREYNFTVWLSKQENLSNNLRLRGFEDLFLFENGEDTELCFSPVPRNNSVIDTSMYSWNVKTNRVLFMDKNFNMFPRTISDDFNFFLNKVWKMFKEKE